jgi:mannosyltransferase OCH1-like enzyme
MNIIALIRKRGLACTLHKLKRRICVGDVDATSRLAYLGAQDYLQKYRYVLDMPAGKDPVPDNPYPNRIWTLWLQGLDRAPAVVQRCVASLRRYHGSEVVVLDGASLAQYVDIPEHVTRKWQAGAIPPAHYSDVVRALLLARYGGVWIDSTYFLLGKIPDFIRAAPLFVFKGAPQRGALANSFLAARAGNLLMRQMASLLCAYWQRESRLASYSIFHLFFAMAVRHSAEGRAQWDSIPSFWAISNTTLQYELFQPFDADRLEQIRRMSPLQKLSYKFPQESFERQGTFYDAVVLNNK